MAQGECDRVPGQHRRPHRTADQHRASSSGQRRASLRLFQSEPDAERGLRRRTAAAVTEVAGHGQLLLQPGAVSRPLRSRQVPAAGGHVLRRARHERYVPVLLLREDGCEVADLRRSPHVVQPTVQGIRGLREGARGCARPERHHASDPGHSAQACFTDEGDDRRRHVATDSVLAQVVPEALPPTGPGQHPRLQPQSAVHHGADDPGARARAVGERQTAQAAPARHQEGAARHDRRAGTLGSGGGVGALGPGRPRGARVSVDGAHHRVPVELPVTGPDNVVVVETSRWSRYTGGRRRRRRSSRESLGAEGDEDEERNRLR